MNLLLESLAPGDGDRELASSIDSERLPTHIAIIMDSNGRWASRRSLPRIAGHRAGVNPVRSTVETCARLGVKALTLYAFSIENWKRPRHEVETLWRLLRFYLKHVAGYPNVRLYEGAWKEYVWLKGKSLPAETGGEPAGL